MGSSSPPQPPTPMDAARAQALTQAGGQMLQIGSMPQQAYAEALDQIAFNPIFQSVQSADQANSALANAKTNQAVGAMTNPYGSAGANAFNREASQRLAGVMGQPFTPGLTQTNTNGVFSYPNESQLPNFSDIVTQANAISKSLPTLNMSDNQVSLMPSATSAYYPPSFQNTTYYPSYFGT